MREPVILNHDSYRFTLGLKEWMYFASLFTVNLKFPAGCNHRNSTKHRSTHYQLTEILAAIWRIFLSWAYLCKCSFVFHRSSTGVRSWSRCANKLCSRMNGQLLVTRLSGRRDVSTNLGYSSSLKWAVLESTWNQVLSRIWTRLDQSPEQHFIHAKIRLFYRKLVSSLVFVLVRRFVPLFRISAPFIFTVRDRLEQAANQMWICIGWHGKHWHGKLLAGSTWREHSNCKQFRKWRMVQGFSESIYPAATFETLRLVDLLLLD